MKSVKVLAGVLLIALTVACSTDPAVGAKKALAEGNDHFAQKRYSEAVVLYRKALQFDPRLAEAYKKLGEAYDRLGDARNAAAQFIRAADLLPADADAQMRAGAFLLAGGAFEDAKSRALKALEVDPRKIEAHLLLAQATARLKDLNGAIDQVEQTLQTDPSDSLVLATLADFRLAQGNTKAAEASLKQAVAVDPTSVTASLGLGRFYMATGRAAEAEEWLKKSLAVDPGNPLANRSLAALYMSTNRLADAEAPLKAAAQGASGPHAKLVLADYYAAVNRNADARKVLEPLIDDPGVASDSRLRLSVIEWRENHRNEAHKWVDQIIANGGDISKAALLKGRYLLAEKQYPQARDVLKKSVDADSQSAASHYWLGTTYRALDDKEAARKEFSEVLRLAPGETGATLQLAQLDLRDGNLDAAESRANDVVRADPRNGVARLTLVDALIGGGKLQAALKEASFLATSLPKQPEPQVQLGRIHLKQGNHAAAERAFQRAIELSDGRGDAVGGLTDTLIASGRLADAQRLTEQWVAKDPKQTAYRLAAARVYKAAKDPDKTEATLKQVLDVDPGNVEASIELTNLYVREQKLDSARGQLETIVAKQPKAVWAHTMIAQSLHLQNRTAEARHIYEHILEIDPRAAIAANNLAMMLAQEGEDLDRALALAQTAVQQQPDDSNFNDTLGTVYLRKGLASVAVAPLELSVRKDGSNPELQYHLGQAYAQIGRKREAKIALEKALALNARFDGADEARRLLGELAQNR